MLGSRGRGKKQTAGTGGSTILLAIPAQGQNPCRIRSGLHASRASISPCRSLVASSLSPMKLVAVGCRSWRYPPPSMAGVTLWREKPSSTALCPNAPPCVKKIPSTAHPLGAVSLIVFMISRARVASPASSGHTDVAILIRPATMRFPTFLLSLPPSPGMFLQPHSHATVIDTPGLDGYVSLICRLSAARSEGTRVITSTWRRRVSIKEDRLMILDW